MAELCALVFKETEATTLESELHEENLKDFHAHPVPKEPVPSPISSIPDLIERPPISPSTPASDTGEGKDERVPLPFMCTLLNAPIVHIGSYNSYFLCIIWPTL